MVIYIVYSNAVKNIETIYFQIQLQPRSLKASHNYFHSRAYQN